MNQFPLLKYLLGLFHFSTNTLYWQYKAFVLPAVTILTCTKRI